MNLSKRKKGITVLILLFVLGFIIPENLQMPVEGATTADYNNASFWYYPWGRSGTHKGVDIFAKHGTRIFTATRGVVLYSGTLELGGNIVLILGPKWRLHYYAHMDKIQVSTFTTVSQKETIGLVGDSGNAAGKQPHLHYAVMTLIPYFWKADSDVQGWKKMFYLNPIQLLER